jgi:hypothetical protein
LVAVRIGILEMIVELVVELSVAILWIYRSRDVLI